MNLFKYVWVFLLCAPIMVAANPNYKYRKSKKINKTYTVNPDVAVAVESSFGDVTFVLWDQNSVSMDVFIEVSGNNEERVMERLQRIYVEFKASSSSVKAESEIPNESSGLFNWLSGDNSTSTKVDFMVKIPRNASVDVSNDYGAVIIRQLYGPLKLQCDFGRLEIGQLLHTNNELSFDYTENSHVDYLKSGVIKADFSKFTVHGSDYVDFSGDYTTANFEALKDLKYNSDFSTIKTEDAISIDGRGDYSTVTIASIQKKAVLKADFGSISIGNLKPSFDELTIKSDYTTLKINYDPAASFSYACRTDFGNLKLGSGFTRLNSKKEMNENYEEGFYGSRSSNSKIDINSSFGTVTIKSNN